MTMEPPPPPPHPLRRSSRRRRTGEHRRRGELRLERVLEERRPDGLDRRCDLRNQLVFSSIGTGSGLGRPPCSCLNLVGWLVGLFLALGWFRVALEVTRPAPGSGRRLQGRGLWAVHRRVDRVRDRLLHRDRPRASSPASSSPSSSASTASSLAEQGDAVGADGDTPALPRRSRADIAGSSSASRSCSR